MTAGPIMWIDGEPTEEWIDAHEAELRAESERRAIEDERWAERGGDDQ